MSPPRPDLRDPSPDLDQLARRTFLTRALTLGAVGGLGLGYLAWRRAAHGALIREFARDASPVQWREVGDRVVDTPPPPDAWLDARAPGTPGSAMPFAVGALVPLVSELTNRLHWERHYRVYAGRLRAAAGAVAAATTDADRAAAAEAFWRPWMQALLHRLHWGELPARVPAGAAVSDAARAAAARLDARLPRHDGFLTLLRHESGATAVVYSSEPAVVLAARGSFVHAIDGHRHAWSYDGTRADWLATWLTLVGASPVLFDTLETADAPPADAPSPATENLVRLLSLVPELPAPIEPIAAALAAHTPTGLGASWVAGLASATPPIDGAAAS